MNFPIRLTYILLIFIFISSLFIVFIKAQQKRKRYEASNNSYRILHHSHKIVRENPIEIVSRFRGDPRKTGVIPNDIFHLKFQAKNLFEKINGSLHGASKATPAVDKSGIYIGSDNGWFYRLSHTGDLIWKVYFAKTEHGVHGTALLSKKYLWIGAYNGILYCLKKKTGEIIWTIDLGDAIGSSPSFYKNQIIVSVEMVAPRAMGYVASVSALDGSLIWKSPLTSAHIHSSVAIHSEKGYGVTGANNGSLFKIDLHSGQLLWTRQLKDAIKSTPLIYKDHIYVSHWGREFTALNEQGEILWSTDIHSRSQSSPTLIPDKEYLLFGTHGKKGHLFSIKAEDGSIVWKKEIENKRALASGISFFSKSKNKYLFLFPCETKAICLMDPANGNVLNKIQTGFLLTGGFHFFKDRFYINLNERGLAVLY